MTGHPGSETGSAGRTAPGWSTVACAKINACLFVGATRASDGRHDLLSVMDNVALTELVTMHPRDDSRGDDIVVCPGVEGPNLALDAVTAFRAATGWDGPPQRIGIRKAIPIAGGMAGGSADAAAALRLVAAAAGFDDAAVLHAVAASLGADVPSQLRGGRQLAEGAGERLTALPTADRHSTAVIVVALRAQLSAGAVYAEFDRRGGARTAGDLGILRRELLVAERGPGLIESGLAINDLEGPAIALCPQIAAARTALRAAGVDHVMVSGSGPTVIAFAPAEEAAEVYRRAQRALGDAAVDVVSTYLTGLVSADAGFDAPSYGQTLIL